MTRKQAIEFMLAPEAGFKHIPYMPAEFIEELHAEINKAKGSLVTVKAFLSFVEMKLANKEKVVLSSTMLEAAIFVGNVLGADPTRVNSEVTYEDLEDLNKIDTFAAKGA